MNLTESVKGILKESNDSEVVKDFIKLWDYADAEDAQIIFDFIAKYYSHNAEELTNIDCHKIADLMNQAKKVMAQRKSD